MGMGKEELYKDENLYLILSQLYIHYYYSSTILTKLKRCRSSGSANRVSELHTDSVHARLRNGEITAGVTLSET